MQQGFFSFLGVIGVVGASFVSIWTALRYVLLGSYRLNGDAAKRLIDKIKKDADWTWITSSEHVVNPKYPDVFDAMVFLKGTLFYFSRSERLLTAGWKGKEDVSSLFFLRWQREKVLSLLNEENGSSSVTICAISPSGQDRLGELQADPGAKVFLNEGSYEDIEKEVANVSRGELKKTGMLLYGEPGNGKTQFVKYLSKKYSLPINVVFFNSDYNNYDIARMFSEIPRRCIVLLEDFDTLFDGRRCDMKHDQVRFTFDSIINALDGVYNDYQGVVFVMTANDIDRIDDSIKNRPSRFKFVREFEVPNDSVRMKILGDKTLVKKTKGLTLDKVFSYRNNK